TLAARKTCSRGVFGSSSVRISCGLIKRDEFIGGSLTLGCPMDTLCQQHRGEDNHSCLRSMCVLRFGYRSVTRDSIARLKECCRLCMQYCSSNHSMPSISVVPRISTVSLVSLFTAVR